jgi:methylated-DNA-[protein]-cysteine S-methyltransferase
MPAAPVLTTRYGYVPSPLGDILLTGGDDALTGLYLLQRVESSSPWVREDAHFEPVRVQLEEYFDGRRTRFDVAMRLEGSPFQREVWSALEAIPYGETTSYGEIARRIGRPTASRAVGAANGRNPISIIIPCHRVIGADNSLTGYGWGIERKAWLLDHERAASSALR